METNEKANILLVDDQPARLLSYEAILGSLGQNLVRAQSGTEALRRLMETEFAAILLDVSMPGMDGFETAALIREHPRFEQTPIIFVTGVHVTDLDRLKGYRMGAVDYVYVPVVPEILRGKVQVLVQLHLQRRELQRLNRNLAATNAELATAHAQLKADNTRALHKLNRTLAQANAELAQANAQLTAEIAERKRAEARLEEAARRKDEFLAILAHELRNPLSAMHNGVRLMGAGAVSEGQLAWVRDLLERQLNHLTRLIEDLLDVSRITSGRITLQRESLDLARVVQRAVEMIRPTVEARGHALTVATPDEPLYVNGDLVRLTQALDNLLGNAAKYMEDGGPIALTLEPAAEDSGFALIRVRDGGIGIPTEMLERVFELFTQNPAAASRTQNGLGIGLALVRGLVELHGGTVCASSDGPGQGSEFVIRLPRLAAGPAPARVPAPAPARPGASATRAARRILIVDDNVDSAKGLAMCLETSGYEVHVAHDGARGIAAACEKRPDLVLLDIGLPDIDGYEVAQRLRAQPQLRDVPLIAMTGFSGEADRRQAGRAGIGRYLVKPIDYDALVEVLAAEIDAPRSGAESAGPALDDGNSRASNVLEK